ncbi:beta family protein [Sinorhizobium numidicum]|uniref:Beta family protein n=1 Tax=Sinorhizobium numidicum TaxID=680248 RepID=A0ABY8D157_9HYPH|nr:hypothetical protein [Sinorhizobium numidicum]WEX77974.1 beta family protein [Sinorhizobium numidicum]WEX84633.1 beta family protein [Sinorhizobium numidicum]
MTVDFDAYRYYPSLRTRLWEMRGYKELGEPEKDKLLPIIVLASHGRTKGIADVGAKVEEVLEGRPRIIDLEQSPIYSCDECVALSNPDKGFAAWRKFVGSQANIVPTALLPSDGPLRDIVRQVMLLEHVSGQVVVRSRSPQSDLPILSAIMSAVDAVDNLLLVLDFGYVRSRVKARTIEAANVINALREIDDAARIVVMGSSYPRSAAAYDDSAAVLEIEERAMHAALGGDAVAIYGDFASIHPEPMEPVQSRFVPRVDYALPDAWVFRRVRADQGGYEQCARRITQLVDWDPSLVEAGVWGAEKISAAARGDLTSMNTPGPWIAARVNMHLWQQIHYRDGAVTVEDADIFG